MRYAPKYPPPPSPRATALAATAVTTTTIATVATVTATVASPDNYFFYFFECLRRVPAVFACMGGVCACYVRAVRFSVARARSVAFFACAVPSGRPAQTLKKVPTLSVECAG